MEAVRGDKIHFSEGRFVGADGIFLGDKNGLARVALEDIDAVVEESYDYLIIVRPLSTPEDALRSELLDLKLEKLRRMVDEAEASAGVGPMGKDSALAMKLAADLVPLVDLLPVPEPFKSPLKTALLDVVQAIVS